jgi:hypothetical protein
MHVIAHLGSDRKAQETERRRTAKALVDVRHDRVLGEKELIANRHQRPGTDPDLNARLQKVTCKRKPTDTDGGLKHQGIERKRPRGFATLEGSNVRNVGAGPRCPRTKDKMQIFAGAVLTREGCLRTHRRRGVVGVRLEPLHRKTSVHPEYPGLSDGIATRPDEGQPSAPSLRVHLVGVRFTRISNRRPGSTCHSDRLGCRRGYVFCFVTVPRRTN